MNNGDKACIGAGTYRYLRPLPVTSRNHNRYILTFVDDFSRKCWLYFLSEKSQTLDKFKEFKALVETQQQKIKCLRSD
jgi:hypothetical protein